ncbi:MAG: hypothetical protein E7395_05870 [Ruminococcaceae bacterium]|nr:hypothetical protein [Oscillospiraceae bacterium]
MKKNIFKIALVIALVFFIIYNLISLSTSSQNTVVAQLETLEITYDFDGIVSRSEEYVKLDMEENGVLDLSVAENEMVKKGKMIAVYYDSSIDETKRKKLAEINKKINEINSSPTSGGSANDTPEKLDDEIDKKINQIVSVAQSANMTEITTLREDINLLLGRKQALENEEIIATDTLESLRLEKLRLEKEYGGNKKEITAPLHGIFSTRVDGYETILTPEMAVSMTVSDFETARDKDVSSHDAANKGVVCKIIDNSKWWLSVLADEAGAKAFKVGESTKLRFAGENKDISATVEYISQAQDGKYIITFSSNAHSEYMLTSRLVSVTAIKSTYSGLKVPLEAIRVKDGNPGVYVRTENTVKYRNIDVLYKNDEIAIVRVDNTKAGSLLLYDEIIVDA